MEVEDSDDDFESRFKFQDMSQFPPPEPLTRLKHGHKTTEFTYNDDPDDGGRRKISVSNVPPDVTEDDLEWIFTNKKKQGGGEVKSLKLDTETRSAVIEFKDSSAVNIIMSKRPIIIKDTELKVEEYEQPLPPLPPVPVLNTIRVTRLPPQADRDFLQFYFQSSDKSGGDASAYVTYKEGETFASVTFESDDVAQRVASQSHRIFNSPVDVTLDTSGHMEGNLEEQDAAKGTSEEKHRPIVPSRGNRPLIESLRKELQSREKSKVNDDTSQEPEANTTHIIVYNVPADADKEFLEMFFEKYGGGPVKDIDIDRDQEIVVIEFEELESVTTVLENKQVKIRGKLVDIKAYTPEPQCTVCVTGLNESASEDLLELYFDSEKKSGGCNVQNIQMDESKGTAYVTFETEEVARRVAERTHTLSGATANVKLHKRHIPTERNDDSRTDTDDTNQEPEIDNTHIIVYNVPPEADEEYLEMFFENTKKKGGGPVKEIDIDRDQEIAVIQFEEPESVRTVLKNRQVKIYGVLVQIEACIPEPQCTVRVYELADSVTKDLLELYFENEKKSSGGDVKDIQLDETEGEACVTFETEEVARRVADRKFHTLSGKYVRVELNKRQYKSVSRQDRKTGGHIHEDTVSNPTGIIVDNLSTKADEDYLQMFFENTKKQGGGPVKHVDIDREESMAMIEFEDTSSVSTVLKHKQVKMFGEVVKITAYSPEPQCTVCVSGLAGSITKDHLELYFENEQKSSGGNVKDIQLDETEEEACVTFETEEVARRVVDRPHTLLGVHLTVKLQKRRVRKESQAENENVAKRPCSQKVSLKGVPSDYGPHESKPCYTDRLLLKGVAETTTTEGLRNFIEALSGMAPTKIVYGEKDGTVMVTFDSQPDFERFAEACRKRSLEGKKISVSKIPVSNCLFVSNVKHTTSEDTIRYYFENKKRSGGGDIEKLLLRSEHEYCLVYFLDHSVVDAVLKKQHVLEGQELDVKLYIDDLGIIYNDGSERRFKIPDPITLDYIDDKNVEFILNSKQSQSEISKALEGLFAELQLPEKGNLLSIKCTLSADVDGCYKIARGWSKHVEDAIAKYLTKLSKAEHPVGNEIFDQVRLLLKDIVIENGDEVMFCHDVEQNVIKIVGYKHAVENLSQKVKEIIQNVCDEADRLKHTAKETLSMFKPWQLQLLKAISHVEEMKTLFPDLDITIDDQRGYIAFEGKTIDVQAAKDKTYEKVNTKFAQKSIDGIHRTLAKLFQTGPVRNEIQIRLARKDLMALYEMDNTTLIIYSYETTISICAEIIRESLDERSIQVPKGMQTAMFTDKWQTFQRETTDYFGEKCFLEYYDDKMQIVVSGIDDVVSEVLNSVDTFLNDNKVEKENLSIDNRNIVRLLETHHANKIDKIAKDLREHSVQIWYGSGNIAVQGTEKGRNLAKKQLFELCRKVQSKQVSISRAGLVSHMASKKGKANMQHVEKTYKVIADIVHGDYVEQDVIGDWSKSSRKAAAEKSSFTIDSRCTLPNGRVLYTGEGNMAQLDVDVIFNSVDGNMSLSGGLGAVLVKKGGDTIAQECAGYITKKGQLCPGDVFVSSAGSLKSKFIVHIASPDWAGGKRKDTTCKILGETVFKALREANNRKVASVAIPAIGCGNYGFPLQNATRTIVKYISNFFREIQDSHIQTVYLVDIKPETVSTFTCAVEDEFDDVERVTQKPDDDNNDKEGNEDDMQFRSSLFKKTLSSKLETQMKSGAVGKQKKNTTAVNVGKTDIEVVRGELANQKVDIIVNNTSKTLNLRYGAVSASILKAGGPSVQQELKQQYPNGIQDDEIAVSSGGSMDCRYILHGCLMAWDGGIEAESALQKMVVSCLEKASKLKLTSIAFPALGMGQLQYPDDVVAKRMFSAADTFISDNPDSTIKDIKFIIYHKDSKAAKTFEQERQTWLASRASKQKTKYKEGGAQRRRKEDPGNLDDDSDVVIIPTHATGAIRITVHQGDITEAGVCCIVNSSDSNMSLTGAVASALLQKCGADLKDEANDVVPQMQRTGIAMTPAPNLRSKFIMHVDSDRDWKKTIPACLKLAEDESINSLAFPALGTAKSLDAKTSAQLMMDSITEFAKSSDGTLENIQFVIYDDKMLEDFKAVVKAYKSAKPKQTSMLGGIWKAFKETIGYGKSGQDPTVEDTSTVKFVFFALSHSSIDDAIKGLETLIDDNVSTEVVKDDCIKLFDKQQVDFLYDAAATKGVKLQVTQTNGRITISGISENVQRFKDDIYKLIREVEKINYQQKIANIQKEVVQWFYIEITGTGQELMEYDTQTNAIIEAAFQDQNPNVRFKDKQGAQYIIDFDSMIEFPELDEEDQVKVIRRDKISDMKAATKQWNPPSTWDPMGTDEFIKVVNLSSSSSEYQRIESLFNAPGTGHSIVQIQRIQNKTLYMQYDAKKQSLEKRNKAGTINERQLWHGTAPDAVDSINTHGFNRSYCGKNATYHGQGVYFAVDAGYSCRDTYSKADPNGNKRIYLCNVLTGEFTKGDPKMRVPPPNPAGGPNAVYDSVVDEPKKPNMFIIFNDTQAYPDYLVTCKK